jgi:hypothetical protein
MNTVDHIMYVTWVYQDTKLDTFFVQQRQRTVSQYLLNGQQVTEDEYDRVGDSVYRDPHGYVIDASSWQAYEKSGLYQMASPLPATKQRLTKFLAPDGSVADHVESVRTYYQVTEKSCVVFDSSSGRVVTVGFFPFIIAPI